MNERTFILLSLTFEMAAKLPEGSKKNKVSFSEEQIERIISLWSTKEVLYKCSHPDYFKKDSRAAALADIVSKADIPGLTTEELWKKMSGLRTYYGKEIGKEKASKPTGTGTKDVYVSKWPFFTSLPFLRDNITPRKTSSTMDAIVDDQEEKRESIQDDVPENSCVFNTSNPPSFKSKKKIQMSKEDELLATCIQELKKPKTETSSDADTIFGQYITTQMKKIPDGYAKEMLKLNIQQTILKVMMPTPARQPFSTIDFSDLE